VKGSLSLFPRDSSTPRSQPLFDVLCVFAHAQSDEAVDNAVKLDGSEFKGRTLKVTRKRVNQPGMAGGPPSGGRGGGRGGRGGGGYGGRGGGFGGRSGLCIQETYALLLCRSSPCVPLTICDFSFVAVKSRISGRLPRRPWRPREGTGRRRRRVPSVLLGVEQQ
jgi:hypothetical protein